MNDTATGPSLDRVLAEVVEWSRATFPNRAPGPTLRHLEREVEEIERALFGGHGEPAEEMADALILLAALADCTGVDLAEAVAAKLAILKTRQWAPPDAAGVREHVRKEGTP